MIQKVKINRFSELDSLRGIAALMVMLSHYTWAYDYHFNLINEHNFHFENGGFGVDIFFIISGFVIFMTLEKITTIREFIISRFSRLYPTYWFSIILTLLVITVFPVPTLGDYTLKQIILNFTMVHGYLKTDHIDQVYWSLGVEMIFYTLMGFIFYFRKIEIIEIISYIWLTICLLLLLFNISFEKYFNQILIVKFAPLFISGIMFFKIKTSKTTSNTYIILIYSFFLLVFKEFYKHDITNVDLQIVILLIITYIVFFIFSIYKIKILNNKILLFFGTISYPMYLLHNVIGYSIIYRVRGFYNNQFFYVSVTAIITITLAYLVTKYIEKPSNKYFKTKFNLISSKNLQNEKSLL